MVSKIAFLYFSYFAWGCLVLLPLVSLREVGIGFYRFFGFTCVALQTLAVGLAIWMGPAFGPNFKQAAVTTGGSLFFTLCFTVALRVRVRWFLWGCFVLAAASGLAGIAFFPWDGKAFLAVHAASSSLLLGSVTLAMMLGHWYLVTPKLSIDPLKRYTKAYIFLTVWMTLQVAISCWLTIQLAVAIGSFHPANLESVFVLFRVAWGLLAPLGMAYFIWVTVAMRSTQSATGILYAAMVCTMMGEGMGLYLTLSMGVPF